MGRWVVCGIWSRKKYGYGNPELHMTNAKLEHNLDALHIQGLRSQFRCRASFARPRVFIHM